MNDSTRKHLHGGDSRSIMMRESGQKDSLLIPTMLEVDFVDRTRKKNNKSTQKKKQGGGLKTVRATRSSSIQNFVNNKSTIRNNASDSSLGGLISVQGGVPAEVNEGTQSGTGQLDNFQINLVSKSPFGARILLDGTSKIITGSQTPSPDLLGAN